MNIMRYEPSRLLNQIDDMLSHSFRPWLSERDTSNVDTSHWTPAVDIKEDEQAFHIFADLPGLDKNDIAISMDNNVLTIKGERSEIHEDKKDNYSRIERKRGTFYRRFSLPDTADGEAIKASMKQGVLSLTIPKKAQVQPRLIEIDEH